MDFNLIYQFCSFQCKQTRSSISDPTSPRQLPITDCFKWSEWIRREPVNFGSLKILKLLWRWRSPKSFWSNFGQSLAPLAGFSVQFSQGFVRNLRLKPKPKRIVECFLAIITVRSIIRENSNRLIGLKFVQIWSLSIDHDSVCTDSVRQSVVLG